MQQSVDNTEIKEERENEKPNLSKDPLTLRGRFFRYDSIFAKLLLPFLSVKYLAEGLDTLFDFNHKIRRWGDPPALKPLPQEKLFGKIPNQGVARWLVSNILTLGFGAAVSSVVAFYTNRTYKDIKALYTDALAYELDKNPKDIGFSDMLKSQNDVVKKTNSALIGRTAKRFGAAASFFIPWGPLFARKKYHNTPQLDNVGFKFGPGIMGMYLFSDAFTRKESFFEGLQEMVAIKINHDDSDPYKIVETQDIERLINLHKRVQSDSYHPPTRSSQEAQDVMQLSSVVARLMNQTYHNTPGEADFPVGKFVYLFGFGLMDKFPESLAYVELANRSKDMKEVKVVAEAIKNGMNPEAVFLEHGIDLRNTAAKSPASPVGQLPAPAVNPMALPVLDPANPAHAQNPEERPTATSYTRIVQKEEPITKKTFTDFAVHPPTSQSLN